MSSPRQNNRRSEEQETVLVISAAEDYFTLDTTILEHWRKFCKHSKFTVEETYKTENGKIIGGIIRIPKAYLEENLGIKLKLRKQSLTPAALLEQASFPFPTA